MCTFIDTWMLHWEFMWSLASLNMDFIYSWIIIKSRYTFFFCSVFNRVIFNIYILSSYFQLNKKIALKKKNIYKSIFQIVFYSYESKKKKIQTLSTNHKIQMSKIQICANVMKSKWKFMKMWSIWKFRFQKCMLSECSEMSYLNS